jgi:crotonobetainyl-CoA:carnitine CoA-transferase CaiB-like acyl-CoA transferase
MEKAGVPCGPINSLDRVFADPHVRARGVQLELDHPRYGAVPSVANPIRFSDTPIQYKSAPPVLGANTREILAGLLKKSGAEIDVLAQAGVI